MLKVLSVFSGAGGLDLGLEGNFINVTNNKFLPPTGLKTIFANDIRPRAKITWENYFNRSDVYHLESIVDIISLYEENKFNFPNADIVTGGFPCQDFSIAGKRQGFNSKTSHTNEKIDENYDNGKATVENRGSLYMWMLKVIKAVEPRMFIAENVKGLTNLEDVFKIIKNDFESLGYTVFTNLLNAKYFGVPQNRERIFFIGLKTSELITTDINPFPDNIYDDNNFITVKDVLNDLLEPNITSDMSQKAYSKAKYYGKKVQGQTEVKWNNVAPTIRAEHHGNIEFRRLSKEHGGVNLDGPERRLTVRECARIQTFPDEYEFVQKGVSASESYKLIGNAVPPLMAYYIGKNISDNWNSWFKD